ncbi:MAG: hypothetical protein KM310_00320 [Clostridiales bacterium]|nr:hypothetical protein [Clostridiales bacterium]
MTIIKTGDVTIVTPAELRGGYLEWLMVYRSGRELYPGAFRIQWEDGGLDIAPFSLTRKEAVSLLGLTEDEDFADLLYSIVGVGDIPGSFEEHRARVQNYNLGVLERITQYYPVHPVFAEEISSAGWKISGAAFKDRDGHTTPALVIGTIGGGFFFVWPDGYDRALPTQRTDRLEEESIHIGWLYRELFGAPRNVPGIPRSYAEHTLFQIYR